MKRISILVLVVCCVTMQSVEARDYIPIASKLRYSTHAFGHKSTGLVPDSVRYSTYAFAVHNSGLIPDTVRYSPYVFSAKHNGLISEYGATYIPAGIWDGDNGIDGDCQLDKLAQSIDTLADSIRHAKPSQRKTTPRPHFRPARHTRSNGTDPRHLVTAYLDRVIPGHYKLQRFLRIDQETVSFDIVIADLNLVIKYWNPAKYTELQQASSYKTQILSNYMTSWAAVANNYETAGTKVVHIVPDNNRQVIAKLEESLETATT